MKHLGDITNIRGGGIEKVDVITFGAPCQDLSIAGKRKGMKHEANGDSETTRSGLFFEAIRIIKEMRIDDVRNGRSGIFVRPRFAVYENVPGAFSSNHGEDFRAVLEEAARVKDPSAVIPGPPGDKWTNSGAVVGDGWSIAWRVHDAQFWGVPQRRRRISLVCDFGGLSAPEILFERKSVSWNPQESGAQREEVTGGAGKSTESTSGAFNPWDSQSARVYSQDGVWHSLNANENGGQSRDSVLAIPINTMVATKTAPEKRTTFGVGEDGDPQFTLQAAHSHAVCAGFSFGQSEKARSIGYQEEISLTLRGGEGGNQKPCVYDARGNGDGQTVNTLTGDHQNRVTDYTALCIGNGQANQSVDTVVGALNTMHDQQAVMVPDVAHTLKAKANCDFRADSETYPVQNSVVRRLTPLECERLQGYPDGWTDIFVERTVTVKRYDVEWIKTEKCEYSTIQDAMAAHYAKVNTENPDSCDDYDLDEYDLMDEYDPDDDIEPFDPRDYGFRKKKTLIGSYEEVQRGWFDSKGKWHKEADSPRYKALGNSIALPYWQWMLRRIAAMYVGTPTLGSLFDGIGGFPLCWQRCGGVTLWASEVDSFCIAVTSRRFMDE